jgi:hypothetical protein
MALQKYKNGEIDKDTLIKATSSMSGAIEHCIGGEERKHYIECANIMRFLIEAEQLCLGNKFIV